MASAPPTLTDQSALWRNRRRAFSGPSPALFLHEDAACEIQERLDEVNRVFTSPAIVTGFPEIWSKAFPKATVVSDTDLIDLTPGAHDLVIHGLGLHWANDPVGQLVQCRRALAPDGLFLGVMFGGQTLHQLRRCLAEAEIALTGGLSPRVAPMGEIRDLGALLQRAGLALPVADSLPRTVTYPSALHLMADLRAMGETNALTARSRRFAPRTLFAQAAALYAAHFATPDGRVEATFDMVTLTGWAPSSDQPKPLRPGSAAARLADVLGAQEHALPDRPND
ncbi:SAM-dependent methyltransferase [Pseudoruegeria sp. SK021]|uniref:SAM-dependent methyltransferase n=1 Tax=Pseudoruegeria sp. SK021 TaxID=1933035 RepID=UPI000A23290A|nr:SAM-dependent methyltransferase [Pseudoruegeria sp. SK021]OSP54636.1 SAM-dependent methyltransferase [Pseudoruegeria sp. SK021]